VAGDGAREAGGGYRREPMSRALLLDCDPGNDDALGIMVASGSRDLTLKAVTTGAGHLSSARTAHNAAIALAVAKAGRVPVTRGAEGPLVRERLIAQALDMERGLDRERTDLAEVAIEPKTTSAEMIAEAATGREPLTIVTTGPLTNLALALSNCPKMASRLQHIVALGGAWGLGNKTAAAEWNVLCDPEAAAIVFGCGAPITLVPIDAASQVTIDDRLVSAVAMQGGDAARFAVELLESLRSTHRPGVFGPPDAPLNDPLAALIAADPKLVRTAPARVDVELAGRHTYGRTVIDFADRAKPGFNCDVVVAFDVEATRRAFVDALGMLS
jgi:inosine-uridine nucleoside N-ribohydrolase